MRINRKLCFDILFKAAIKSIQDWARDVMNMRMGIIAVLHTFGQDLKFHPHIHLIVTGGGLSLDNKRWIKTDSRYLMNHAGLKKRWKYNVITLFRQAYKEKKLRFPQNVSYLKQSGCFAGLLNRIYKYTWYAHIGASLADPRFSVRYVGRYTKRAVIAEYRIIHLDDKRVAFVYKDYADDCKSKVKWLSVFSFISRLIIHIPDKNFKQIRHAGIFCNRWKGEYLPIVRKLVEQDNDKKSVENQDVKPANWRERQILYNEADPLICENCGVEMVFVGLLFGVHQFLHQVFESYENGTDQIYHLLASWDP